MADFDISDVEHTDSITRESVSSRKCLRENRTCIGTHGIIFLFDLCAFNEGTLHYSTLHIWYVEFLCEPSSIYL